MEKSTRKAGVIWKRLATIAPSSPEGLSYHNPLSYLASIFAKSLPLALIAVLLLLVALPPQKSAGDSEFEADVVENLPPGPHPEKSYPRLDSSLAAYAEASVQKSTLSRFGWVPSSEAAIEKVRVGIEVEARERSKAVAAIEAAGGIIETTYGELVQTVVPVQQLIALADSPGVRHVAQLFPPTEEAITSEGLSGIGVPAWHSTGFNGEGVKIAVVDTGFKGYQALLGTELPSNTVLKSFRADHDIEAGRVHGAGVSEIIYDIAPGAQLYLVNISTLVELGNAVDWLIAEDVDIISHSLSWYGSGAGDGGGPVNAIVKKASEAGILWVNSAGDEAQKHWSGSWADADADGWLEFQGADEGQTFNAGAGTQIEAFLTWDDAWGQSGNDYDLYLVYSSTGAIVASSTSRQDGDDGPEESLSYQVPALGTYSLAIRKYSSSKASRFRLFSINHGTLQYTARSGSIGIPADSPNALAVGALWGDSLTTIDVDSAQGPTLDGRPKPDLVAPARVSTATYGPKGCTGTSFSTAHVSAAAALVKQRYPTYTGGQIQSFLEGRAVDLGDVGKDNLSGSGRLRLGSASAPMLSDGTVGPENGDSATAFLYTVVYTDIDNQAPDAITVSIDGQAGQPMTRRLGQDGNYSNGEIYEYTRSGLAQGSHTFKFAASDGWDAAMGDISPHNGPTIAGTATRIIEINFPVTDAVVSPDGKFAFMTSKADRKLYIVNLADGSTQSINFTRMPESIAITPAGDAIYVAELTQDHAYYWPEPQEGYIAHIDPVSMLLVREFHIAEDPGDLAASSDGYLYVSGGSNQWDYLTGYDVASTEQTGSGFARYVWMTSRINLHPNDKAIYLVHGPGVSPGTLVKYEVSMGKVGTMYQWPRDYHGMAVGHDLVISPDGLKIFTQGGHIFTSSDNQSEDMIHLGSLGTSWSSLTFDSATKPYTIDASFYSGKNTLIRKWNHDTYEQTHSWSVNGKGRFIFYRNEFLVVITEDGDFASKSRIWMIGVGGLPPTMDPVSEPQGKYHKSAPKLSHLGFDDVALDDGWYQLDSYTGPWTPLFNDDPDTAWDAVNWTLPGFEALGEGTHTIYFKASDDAGNTAGAGGELKWQFFKDVTAPAAATAVRSTSHTLETWSKDGTVDVIWTAATDNMNALDGYSILWDANADTDPDATKDIEEDALAASSGVFTEGNIHYFHIRAVDSAGNWGTSAHLGPFLVDTTPPTAPTNLARTTMDGDPTPTFAWSPASDTASGIDHYEARIDLGGWSSIGTVTNYSWPTALQSGSHTLEVRAVDKAGNSGPISSLEFLINTPPAVTHVTAWQTPGSNYVDIAYDVADTEQSLVAVSVQYWNGNAWTNAVSLTGAVGNVSVGAGKSVTWNVRADFNGQYRTDVKIKVIADDGRASSKIGFADSAAFTVNTPVIFYDVNTEAVVREALNNLGGSIYSAHLVTLTALEASGRSIVNLSGLEFATNLVTLRLNNNQISDLTPLSALPNLTNLYLSANQINNIQPLVDNSGLSSGDTVDLTDNPLGGASVNTYISQLRARGVTVLSDVNSSPIVANVAAAQTPGTGTVTIGYGVADVEQPSVTVSLQYWNGSEWIGAASLTGAVGGVGLGVGKVVTWIAAIDIPGQYLANVKVKVVADDGQAKNNVGSAESAAFTLDTKAPTGCGPGGSPANNATNVSTSPILLANAGTDDGSPLQYYFILATNSSFTAGVQVSGWQVGTSWKLSGLTIDLQYWWKVKARDSFGNEAEYAPASNFTTGSAVLAASAWPKFRHDARNTGRSTFTGPDVPSLKWKFTTGSSVYSSPAIGADGVVYVGSGNGNLYAILPDGTLKWNYGTGGPISSSPAIAADGTIYVGSIDKNLYAINPDGTLKWRLTTGGGVTSSPAIGEDRTVYVGSGDKMLYAINADGTLKWSFFTGDEVQSSPAIGADGTVYVGSRNGRLYALRPDGTLNWSFPAGDWIASSPAIGGDGTIYLHSVTGNLYALNHDGTVKWSSSIGMAGGSPAIGIDGTIFAGTHDKGFFAVNPDGSAAARLTTISPGSTSPAIGGDGTVYIVGTSLYALKPDGVLSWSFNTNGGLSSPAIGPGVVYVGSYDGSLYAIGVAPPNSPPTVSNVVASQLPGTGDVTITYDVTDAAQPSVTVSFQYWNGSAWANPGWYSGALGTVTVGMGKQITWRADADFNRRYRTDMKIRIIADDGQPRDNIGYGESAAFILDTGGIIKFGVIASWSGVAASLGAMTDQTISVVEGQIQNEGGVRNGRPVQFVRYDDASQVSGATAGFGKLVEQDGVLAVVIGGGFSGTTAASSDAAEGRRVPFFDLGPHPSDLTQRPYTVRTNYSESAPVDRVAGFILGAIKPQTVALLADDLMAQRDHVALLRDKLAAAGIKVVSQQYVPLGAADFTPYLARVKFENPDVLITDHILFPSYEAIFRQITELGGWGDIKHVSLSPASSASGAVMGLPGAQGSYHWSFWLPGLPYPGARTFEQDFLQKHGQMPSVGHAYLYNTLWTAIKAIGQAVSDTPYFVAQAARSGQLSWDSPAGRMIVGTNGETNLKGHIAVVSDGKLVPVEEWKVDMGISTSPNMGSIEMGNLALGAREGATDAFLASEDDAIAAPDPQQGINGYFSYPANDPASTRKLAKSVVAPAQSITWDMEVKTIGGQNTQLTITWDVSQVPAKYASVQLLDRNGTVLRDMKASNSYQFSVAAGQQYNFKVRASKIVTVALQLKAGWNLISLPVQPSVNTPSVLLPDVVQLYEWNAEQKSYSVPTQLVPGKGYWALVFSDVTQTISGTPVSQYQINGVAGWHLVGSLSIDGKITVSKGTVWDQFYGWDAASKSYQLGSTLIPGRGYWALGLTQFTAEVAPKP